jgi:hypothetical protein
MLKLREIVKEYPVSVLQTAPTVDKLQSIRTGNCPPLPLSIAIRGKSDALPYAWCCDYSILSGN